jgi:hypothetical protein
MPPSKPRSAELRFGKVRRESPVRADSEIGAPLSAMLHGGSVKTRIIAYRKKPCLAARLF